MAVVGNRLGKCEVCGGDDAKYKCPKCEVKTCCLHCVNIHKHELMCDGIRNKVAFKAISKFSNLDLLSDYRLLEDVTRSVDSYVRDPLKNYTREHKDLPVHLFRLRAAATKRGTRLLFLPGNFSRHKENSTYLNWKTQVISWRIEWIFPQSDIKHIDHRVEESSRLATLLDRFLDPVQCPLPVREPLQFYQSAGHSGITLLLKAEKVCKASFKFHILDSSKTLRHALQGKSVVEFPTVFVILNIHKDAYEYVNSDEEEEQLLEQHPRLSASQNTNASNHMNKKGKRKDCSLLFHNSDMSSEGSDDDGTEVKSLALGKEEHNSNGLSNLHNSTKKLKSDLNVLCNGIRSDGKLLSASKLLSGSGQLNIPPYDVLIKLPH